MCGFVAAIDRLGALTPELLTAMRDSIVHRGPDEAGIWLSGDRRVGFGTRRLSIIDLEAGHQPMSSDDGMLTIAYNGELYNHVALRAGLERQGRGFHTRCDTEVVLAAYEQYGEACLDRFEGMFAFAIWDERKQRLFFARDRAGKKPLYYTRTPNGWIFASEIKALLVHPDVRRSVDQEALAHYLSFLTTPAPKTLFSGISKVPAAHWGSLSLDGELRLRRWWTLPGRSTDVAFDEVEAAEELRRLFNEAVEKRMMSEVPIGVYLSGGVDSSANVAFMARHSPEPLRTFSVAFADEPSLNELAHARAVANVFATAHHEIILRDADVVRSLPAIIHHQDEPIADPVCVPLFHLAQLTKASGVTVVQIGEGSDESFFGYPIYTQVFAAAERLRRLCSFLPRAGIAAAVDATGRLAGDHRYEFMRESVRRGVPPPHGIAGLSERHKRRLLRDGTGATGAYRHLVSEFGTGWTDAEIGAVGLAHEFGQRLPELLLMRIDKMTMAASVEARAPFLDHRLVEFAARLPFAAHWKDGGGKRVLKRAFAGIVPDEVLQRRKQGFGAPVWRWLSSLNEIGEHELLRPPILEHFHEPAVRDLLYGRPSSRRGFEFWVLLNFALWHRHWIEGEDLRDSQSFGAFGDDVPALLPSSAR